MDISRHARTEIIHNYQTCFAKNITKKSFRQEKNDTTWKFGSAQRNEEHRKWQINSIYKIHVLFLKISLKDN